MREAFNELIRRIERYLSTIKRRLDEKKKWLAM